MKDAGIELSPFDAFVNGTFSVFWELKMGANDMAAIIVKSPT